MTLSRPELEAHTAAVPAQIVNHPQNDPNINAPSTTTVAQPGKKVNAAKLNRSRLKYPPPPVPTRSVWLYRVFTEFVHSPVN